MSNKFFRLFTVLLMMSSLSTALYASSEEDEAEGGKENQTHRTSSSITLSPTNTIYPVFDPYYYQLMEGARNDRSLSGNRFGMISCLLNETFLYKEEAFQLLSNIAASVGITLNEEDRAFSFGCPLQGKIESDLTNKVLTKIMSSSNNPELVSYLKANQDDDGFKASLLSTIESSAQANFNNIT